MAENVKGTRALIRRLEAVGKLTRDEEALEDWQTRTVDLAKFKHRPNKKTGMTSGSIRQGARSKDEAEVEAGGAAVFLEFGTKAHTIRPRNKRLLAWPRNASDRRLSGAARKGTTDFIFARQVNHPGTKPYPFLVPAAEEARDRAFGRDEVIKRWNKAG